MRIPLEISENNFENKIKLLRSALHTKMLEESAFKFLDNHISKHDDFDKGLSYYEKHSQEEILAFMPIRLRGNIYIYTRDGFIPTVSGSASSSIVKSIIKAEKQGSNFQFIRDRLADERLLLYSNTLLNFKKSTIDYMIKSYLLKSPEINVNVLQFFEQLLRYKKQEKKKIEIPGIKARVDVVATPAEERINLIADIINETRYREGQIDVDINEWGGQIF